MKTEHFSPRPLTENGGRGEKCRVGTGQRRVAILGCEAALLCGPPARIFCWPRDAYAASHRQSLIGFRFPGEVSPSAGLKIILRAPDWRPRPGFKKLERYPEAQRASSNEQA